MSESVLVHIGSFSDLSPEIQEALQNSGERFIRADGACYYYDGNRVYFCDAGDENARLFRSLVLTKTKGEGQTEEDAVREVLKGNTDPETMRRAGIVTQEEYCVVLFHVPFPPDRRAIRELFPLEKKDRIVFMDGTEIALIMQTNRRDQDEVYEYTAAAVETLESEAGLTSIAGIGQPVSSASALTDSYRKAKAALAIGSRHHLPGQIFAYSKLALERLAESISPEKAEAFRREILPAQSERLMTNEILETIRVFFLNDLNLSTTARQLFIHRITLLYRMEKIRKITGLDLRKFEDAAVFRFVMSLTDKKKYDYEKN